MKQKTATEGKNMKQKNSAGSRKKQKNSIATSKIKFLFIKYAIFTPHNKI